MRSYDQRTPSIGDVVMLKSDEFIEKESRHYFVITEISNFGHVVCLSSDSLTTIEVDKVVLMQMEAVDKHELRMPPQAILPENRHIPQYEVL